MFDALLKPKFYSKCKSCLRLIKTRLETIRKKRNAVQKFLKKDIAELLRSSLDYNAYGRAEGLLIEQNMSSCYELVAKFATSISAHVRDLYKQRDCPDQCKEAIPSLMYAAARFSDLPELRHLRTLFTQKYGNSLETYISQEFVERLRQDPPSKEMKIQLLHDLAKEFSIEWDSKALEQRLYSPPQLHQEKPKHHDLNDYEAVPKIDDERDTQSQGRKNIRDASWRLQTNTDDETTTDISFLDDPKASSSSSESVYEVDLEIKKPFSYNLIPPPYVKENLNKGECSLKETTAAEAPPEKESNHDLHEPVAKVKPIPRSVRRRRPNRVTDSKTPTKVDSAGMESEKAKQLAADEGDSRDEERIMDGLLLHYSKKQSPFESSTRNQYTKAYPLKGLEYDNGNRKSNLCAPLVRGTSLPPEETNKVETLEGLGRATSFVPEMLRTVHPTLPDYDDLLTRLAALRGR
ncbi:vacuolar protein sorting-associated protein IST1 [Abrus precatorius]|uniref:Vacuolar protein sorting-associated protein IST1 n=1 Tax=Abrus precatorius TaxID=3816 RepID=A0A8B8KI40_ABRPR|nr:vacuolar protein sorting-associated protein IST1 [Abrus precatorius]